MPLGMSKSVGSQTIASRYLAALARARVVQRMVLMLEPRCTTRAKWGDPLAAMRRKSWEIRGSCRVDALARILLSAEVRS